MCFYNYHNDIISKMDNYLDFFPSDDDANILLIDSTQFNELEVEITDSLFNNSDSILILDQIIPNPLDSVINRSKYKP